MTLGRKDFSVTSTDGGADVFRLTGLLRDDDLISHDGSFGRIDSRASWEHIANKIVSQAVRGSNPFRARQLAHCPHNRFVQCVGELLPTPGAPWKRGG